ncbi:MAG TPA: ZIP family metal transporter [Salinimicrobium sp.]|nr:ZIP family metal transporter [Salinimicrobium sp.]
MVYFLPILSVFIGYLISLLLKPGSSQGFKLLLSFSGAYLLSVTVFELLPDVYHSETTNVGLFIMIGLLLQILLEFLSKGVEHGHVHHHELDTQFPLVLLVSLSIHSLLEGFPLHSSESLLYGVFIHNVPVATVLSTFLINSKIGKWRVLLFVSIFAIMTPLGSYLQQHLQLSQNVETYLNAVVIGIFLHISTTILFEASKNHKFNASKLAVIIFGIVLAYFL